MYIEKQALIDKFFLMIRRLNGTALDRIEVKKFFTQVTEAKQFTPPTVEFMTVLKTFRPVLFYEFKAALVPDTNIYKIANINFDLGQAILNLGITNEQQLQLAVKGKD